MNLLTYVNNILTVDNGNSHYHGEHEKPAFITGINFYYEPTYQTMDDVPLTDEIKSAAEEYINTFIFDTVTPINTNVFKHCVDAKGTYTGYHIPVADEITVETLPPYRYGYFWFNNSWVEAYVIDENGKLVCLGGIAVGSNYYIPAILVNNLVLDKICYEYDKTANTVVLNTQIARDYGAKELTTKMAADVNALLGYIGVDETVTFFQQNDEAKAWLVDNTAPTPFIDKLLIFREQNETKAELVNKIIANAEVYIDKYPPILGKFQKFAKALAIATTDVEIASIIASW